MATIVLEKKRKNIDLPVDALQKLSIMAAAQGKSVKAFIEGILVSKAKSFEMDVRENPSPSGDEFFDDPANLSEIEARLNAHKEGKTKIVATLRTREDIEDFIKNI